LKKICVFSDSHGYADNMLAAIERERPDLVIHLGDGAADLDAVRRRFPALLIESLEGNCDRFCDALTELHATVAGKRIFAVHGHRHGVKLDPGLTRLRFAAMEDRADIVLYGHTHAAHNEKSGGMLIVNPGSCGYTARPTYAVIVIDGDTVTAEIRRAE